jgi:hypothetical protein
VRRAEEKVLAVAAAEIDAERVGGERGEEGGDEGPRLEDGGL